ncbi:MAG TPA: hypothetical protein VIS29_17375 [Streptomyces sp.]
METNKVIVYHFARAAIRPLSRRGRQDGVIRSVRHVTRRHARGSWWHDGQDGRVLRRTLPGRQGGPTKGV